jgi:beta-glucosidase
MTFSETVPQHGASLEERAALTSGSDFWRTKDAAGIPSMLLTDGPHGLRLQRAASDHLGLADSVPATCFPPAVGLGASFDPDLIERVAGAIGAEAAAEGVAVVLGPGINIKRSPLCGRNFEYFSEDPLVSGVMGAAWVRGLQARGVGASLKHFAANNQETDRLRVSSDVDQRPLREIYLRAFQRVVEDAKPWTVMCSYNRINGVYASQDPWLLTDVLRGEWGFDGVVVSDWGAVDDRVASLSAGLDLEMPSSGGRTDAEIVAAVRSGVITENALDRTVARLATLAARVTEERSGWAIDLGSHHRLAREAASRSIVLLKNEGALLPLDPSSTVAVIGAFAAHPRFQGAGSSLINPTKVDVALDEIRAINAGRTTYAEGFALDAERQRSQGEDLRAEAAIAAANASVAIVFLGLPAEDESEGFDRENIDLPQTQLDLLDSVLTANPNAVVVLSHGGAVALPFADRVPAILDAALLGQAGGGGTADVLFGIVNPSAKLTETVPLRITDTPAFGNFPGEAGHVRYGEGIFVGYRWYDARDLEVAFPFGHGLSYTSFAFGSPSAVVLDSGDVEVRLTLANTGYVPGREVVQAYVSLTGSIVERPPRELKSFECVELGAGEQREVVLLLRRADLAYWGSTEEKWLVESGVYTIDIGSSSRDIRASTEVELAGDPVQRRLSRNSSLAEVVADPAGGAALHRVLEERGASHVLGSEDGVAQMLASFPIGRMSMFGLTDDDIASVIATGDSRPE